MEHVPEEVIKLILGNLDSDDLQTTFLINSQFRTLTTEVYRENWGKIKICVAWLAIVGKTIIIEYIGVNNRMKKTTISMFYDYFCRICDHVGISSGVAFKTYGSTCWEINIHDGIDWEDMRSIVALINMYYNIDPETITSLNTVLKKKSIPYLFISYYVEDQWGNQPKIEISKWK